MIIDVFKYLILGTKEDLDQFFYRAQQNGFMEFISPSTRREVEYPEQIQTLISALKVLKKLPLRKKFDGYWDVPYADEIAKKVLVLRDEVEKLAEEKRLIEAEIARVSPFGDFSMADIDFIEKESKKKIQFFCMKADKSPSTEGFAEVVYVGSEYDLDYFISINTQPKSYPDMIEMRIDRSISELHNQLEFVRESLHDFEMELKSFEGHIDVLHEALLSRLNDHNLLCAKKEVSFPLHNSLFAVEAWVPKTKVVALHSLLDGLAVHVEPIKIEETDKVPTHMENKGMARLGEDLVRIYDVPATTDADPSGWVFWFFALFFAIIVADGGYGLLYLALAAYMKYKVPVWKNQSRRLLRLFVILSVFVVGWGVVTSSFFGVKISPDSLLGKISPMQHLVVQKASYHLSHCDDVYYSWLKDFPALQSAQTGQDFLSTCVEKTSFATKYLAYDSFSDSILLEFSLILGVIHISFSFFRYLKRNWAGLGWVAFMCGSYLFFPSKVHATSFVHYLGLIDPDTATEVGLQLLYGGIGVAVFLALVQRRLKGLTEIMNLVQVFADVLSYLRLYALALAGSIMASTFNEMGAAVGFVAGVVVILVGHGVNILLGLMAGVIHGLRLNFIEWYHYSFDGGGRLLKPLMLFKSDD